jgi:hypothetical protein
VKCALPPYWNNTYWKWLKLGRTFRPKKKGYSKLHNKKMQNLYFSTNRRWCSGQRTDMLTKETKNGNSITLYRNEANAFSSDFKELLDLILVELQPVQKRMDFILYMWYSICLLARFIYIHATVVPYYKYLNTAHISVQFAIFKCTIWFVSLLR